MSNEGVPIYGDDDPNASIFHDDNEFGSSVISSSDAQILNNKDLGDAVAATDTAKVVGASPTVKISHDTVMSPELQQEAISESPKSLFKMAFEKVMNSDRVLKARDHFSIFWKGRHIDAIEKDIQRLEKLAGAQEIEAGRHEQRLQASNEASSKLAAIRGDLGLKDAIPSQMATRDEEYAAVKGRAESHKDAGEKISRELAKKRELKAGFERDRDSARGRVAERFQKNINANTEAVRNIDSQVDQIQQNLGVADKIVASLQDKQEVARAFLNNPNTLSADKQMAKSLVQDLEGRIQDMKSKMQSQKDRIAQYENKKAALGTQRAKWEAKIVKKSEQTTVNNEEASDTEKEEGFFAETATQIAEREDALIENQAFVPGVEVPVLEDRSAQEVPEQESIEQQKSSLATYGEMREVLRKNETMKVIADFLNTPNVRKLDNPDNIREWKDIVISDYDKLVHAQGLYKRLYVIGISENVNEDDVPARLVIDLQTFKDDLERAGYGDIERNKSRSNGTEVPTLLANTYNFLDSFLKNFETVSGQDNGESVIAEEKPSLIDAMNRAMNSELEDPAIDELMNQYAETDRMNEILEQNKSPQDMLIVRLLRIIFSMLSLAEDTDKANKSNK